MINAKLCPYCHEPAVTGCPHLALAVEGRDFVHHCVEQCQGQNQWQALCQDCRAQRRLNGDWSPEQEDWLWLETAFCDKFLRRLPWFGGLDHEWRTGPRTDQGGYWVLLWSKDPARLWWELRDEFERHLLNRRAAAPASSVGEMRTPPPPATQPLNIAEAH
jgi:hypothetical protein